MDVTKSGSRKKQLINGRPAARRYRNIHSCRQTSIGDSVVSSVIEHRFNKPEVVGLNPTLRTKT